MEERERFHHRRIRRLSARYVEAHGLLCRSLLGRLTGGHRKSARHRRSGARTEWRITNGLTQIFEPARCARRSRLVSLGVRAQMRKSLKVVAITALALISFGAGAITAAIFHLGSPIVTVLLQNASTQRIAFVHLEHEHGSSSVTNIEPGDSRKLRFYAPGESSYRIQVAFADGHTITGG